VMVTVSRSNGSVVLAVRDDGRGFEPVAEADADGSSMGLRLLEDLVEERNGRLEIDSGAGRGTVLTMELDA
jgi:signal transduction histidine kinase